MNTIKPSYRIWTKVSDLNPNYVKSQQAVRGLLSQTAQQFEAELVRMKVYGIPNNRYPFDEVTYLNLGNPQSFGQKPLSFNRSVLSCILDPSLLQNKHINKDVRNRAQLYMKQIGCSIGAQTNPAGYPFVRQAIAEYDYSLYSFIQKRDNSTKKQDIENIFLTDGASQGIILTMNCFLQPNDGVMIPIPQFPIYSGVVTQLGCKQIPYYLNETSGWQVDMSHLDTQYQFAQKMGIKPKLLVVINPGNPTGQVFDRETVETLIKFSYDRNLLVLADEVYQRNVYTDRPFISFKEVRDSMPPPYNEAQVFSFHSISKGVLGECGFRGGYVEFGPLSPEVQEAYVKQRSMALCANTIGQILTGLMVSPPTSEEGCSEETVEKYNQEEQGLYLSLKRRAEIVTDYLNQTKGIECQPIQGAMYAFPKLDLSDKFINKAKEQNLIPDVYYCLEMLRGTGLVVVPGSGFHQYPDSYHFRMTTLLMPEERLLEKMKNFRQWHERFMGY